MRQDIIVDTEQNAQLGKLRAEHRRWLASKLNRNKYGDKIDIQHNVTMDIAPALVAAAERLKTLGVTVIDVPANQLEEIDSDAI